MSGPAVPAAYEALIDSPRVSASTRRALRARACADDPGYRPTVLTPAQMDILRAMLRRILPQDEAACIDLAARLDAELGQGSGDGWRFAALPEDGIAYASGLAVLDGQARALHGSGFVGLRADAQDGLLARAAGGKLAGADATLLDQNQMRLWFEDVCGDAVRLYVAHPATLARIGYSGIGYGGDGADKPGFRRIGLGEREAWEPVAEAAP